MDFQQLIEKINAEITTNGAGEITGAKLNEVLRDIVVSVVENIDTDTVRVFISNNVQTATFMWPFEDTAIGDIVMDGYDGNVFGDNYKFPLDGMEIKSSDETAIYSQQYGWVGDLLQLKKSEWYSIQYATSRNVNCSIYLRRPN